MDASALVDDTLFQRFVAYIRTTWQTIIEGTDYAAEMDEERVAKAIAVIDDPYRAAAYGDRSTIQLMRFCAEKQLEAGDWNGAGRLLTRIVRFEAALTRRRPDRGAAPFTGPVTGSGPVSRARPPASPASEPAADPPAGRPAPSPPATSQALAKRRAQKLARKQQRRRKP